MNRAHLELCSSERWMAHLSTKVVPWALERAPLGGELLEIGPGDGGFLPDLARRFAHVTALDNSPTMLDLAHQVCLRERLDNVELRLGDALTVTEVTPPGGRSVLLTYFQLVPLPAAFHPTRVTES